MALTPAGSRAANYAFDVTPARLVTALITDRGVCDASEEGSADAVSPTAPPRRPRHSAIGLRRREVAEPRLDLVYRWHRRRGALDQAGEAADDVRPVEHRGQRRPFREAEGEASDEGVTRPHRVHGLDGERAAAPGLVGPEGDGTGAAEAHHRRPRRSARRWRDPPSSPEAASSSLQTRASIPASISFSTMRSNDGRTSAGAGLAGARLSTTRAPRALARRATVPVGLQRDLHLQQEHRLRPKPLVRQRFRPQVHVGAARHSDLVLARAVDDHRGAAGGQRALGDQPRSRRQRPSGP